MDFSIQGVFISQPSGLIHIVFLSSRIKPEGNLNLSPISSHRFWYTVKTFCGLFLRLETVLQKIKPEWTEKLQQCFSDEQYGRTRDFKVLTCCYFAVDVEDSQNLFYWPSVYNNKGLLHRETKETKESTKNPNFFNINNWKLHPQTDVVYVCKLSKGRKDHSPNEVIIIY